MSLISACPARRACLRALAIAPLLAAATAFAQDPRAGVVVTVAREWLELVDRGEVAGSYARAGERFRKAVSGSAWSAAYEQERRPRGALVQRGLYQTVFNARVPGASSDGEFATLAFRTAFANQSVAMETVSLERESDGAWRVVGYFIR